MEQIRQGGFALGGHAVQAAGVLQPFLIDVPAELMALQATLFVKFKGVGAGAAGLNGLVAVIIQQIGRVNIAADLHRHGVVGHDHLPEGVAPLGHGADLVRQVVVAAVYRHQGAGFALEQGLHHQIGGAYAPLVPGAFPVVQHHGDGPGLGAAVGRTGENVVVRLSGRRRGRGVGGLGRR